MGPSEADVYVWWWMCIFFGDYLCDTITSGTIDSAVHVDAFCCLSTNSTRQVPGHSPHWNQDVSHQINAKTSFSLLVMVVYLMLNPFQTCAGYIAGSEATGHSYHVGYAS